MSRLDRVVVAILLCVYPLLWLVPVVIRTVDPALAVRGTFRHTTGGMGEIDPWGRPLVSKDVLDVVPPGTPVSIPANHYAYELYSLGPDGIDAGGAGDDVVLVSNGVPLFTTPQFAKAGVMVRILPAYLRWFPLVFLLPSYLLGRFVLRSLTPAVLVLLGACAAAVGGVSAVPLAEEYLAAIDQTSVLDPRLSFGLAIATLVFAPGAAAHFYHRPGGPGWREAQVEEDPVPELELDPEA